LRLGLRCSRRSRIPLPEFVVLFRRNYTRIAQVSQHVVVPLLFDA